MQTRIWILAVSLLGILSFGYYGARPHPVSSPYLLSQDTLSLSAEVQAKVGGILVEHFGSPEDPRVPASACADLGVSPERLKRGRDFYRRQCLHCHGTTGDGAGPTAPWLAVDARQPRPRDYRHGTFKITSTSIGSLPTRDDLLRTLKNGMPGTYMPSFSLYDDETLQSVIDYILHLSVRGNVERLLVATAKDDEEVDEEAYAEALGIVVDRWKGASGKQVGPTGPRPEPTPESIAKGRELFLAARTNCKGCHGDDGTGAGLAAQGMEPDVWGNVTLPANLTEGVYRGGPRPLDLWRRIYSGVKGTPMPGFGETLSEEEIWHLVHFVQSLANRGGGR